MSTDYEQIREFNKGRYGWDIERTGKIFLSDQYADRTHFIYELLQNAEDALSRRQNWQGSRTVSFNLDDKKLRVSHYGIPFNHDDVTGVCGIAESNKTLTEIGHFGIGFKSVYAFSDRPEVHSGQEHFAIEKFVLPVAVEPLTQDLEETVVMIPFKTGDKSNCKSEISAGLSQLNSTSLLFLREINEISWTVDGIPAGCFKRTVEEKGSGVRIVHLRSNKDGNSGENEAWLVFSRSIDNADGQLVGQVEIAWSLIQDDTGETRIQQINPSHLSVYFPTDKETGLGFLIQGPYRTTPARDNVPTRDDWNQKCVVETAELLETSLLWLRENSMLDATVLQCLPLDSERFYPESMFGELYEHTKNVLMQSDVIPSHGGGHVSAEKGCLSRNQELRELISPDQLGLLEGRNQSMCWVDGQISQDNTPILRRYLTQDLNMHEITPLTFLIRLNQEFLEVQDDIWILRMYEFLNSFHGMELRRRMREAPLVRLSNGSHIVAFSNGEAQAFLPGETKTGFPTVQKAVCESDGALGFLKSLGLTEADPVDNVIRNVLPKYQNPTLKISAKDYATDINQLLNAWESDLPTQRKKLVSAIWGKMWVRAVDATKTHRLWIDPRNLYLPTNRLQALFEDVQGVIFVDTSVPCLNGPQVNKLLVESGASRFLRPVEVECDLPDSELDKIRRDAGQEVHSDSSIQDFEISGLNALLKLLPNLDLKERSKRVEILWNALIDLYEKHDGDYFDAHYTWSYYQGEFEAFFDSAFVRTLKAVKWVPDSSGELQKPENITFKEIGWRPNAFLQQKIEFKPTEVELLARAAGIEPAVIAILKELGITNEEELRKRVKLEVDATDSESNVEGHESQKELRRKNEVRPDTKASSDETTRHNRETHGGEATSPDQSTREPQKKHAKNASGIKPGNRPVSQYVSFIRVVGEHGGSKEENLEHSKNLELEKNAIELILAREPDWKRTPTNNPGFDLFKGNSIKHATEWCEVKAMASTREAWPATMTHTQFEWAQKCGSDFWLYIVEKADTSDAAIVRIQNPARRASRFTFDHGWKAIAAERE